MADRRCRSQSLCGNEQPDTAAPWSARRNAAGSVPTGNNQQTAPQKCRYKERENRVICILFLLCSVKLFSSCGNQFLPARIRLIWLFFAIHGDSVRKLVPGSRLAPQNIYSSTMVSRGRNAATDSVRSAQNRPTIIFDKLTEKFADIKVFQGYLRNFSSLFCSHSGRSSRHFFQLNFLSFSSCLDSLIGLFLK